MSRIVDADDPIKTKHASKEYRDNWDRIFGDLPDDPTPTPPVLEDRAVELGWTCPCCCRFDNSRIVTMVDREKREFGCVAGVTALQWDTVHSFDDIP